MTLVATTSAVLCRIPGHVGESSEYAGKRSNQQSIVTFFRPKWYVHVPTLCETLDYPILCFCNSVLRPLRISCCGLPGIYRGQSNGVSQRPQLPGSPDHTRSDAEQWDPVCALRPPELWKLDEECHCSANIGASFYPDYICSHTASVLQSHQLHPWPFPGLHLPVLALEADMEG